MALQLLYIIAFTVLAVLAIANLIRNLISLGIESQRPYGQRNNRFGNGQQTPPHPEFLDDSGRIINEPLLVMRSMTMDDAREQLDALYEASPGPSNSSNINNSNLDSREE